MCENDASKPSARELFACLVASTRSVSISARLALFDVFLVDLWLARVILH